MAELKTQNEKPLTVHLLVALVPFYVSVATLHHEKLFSLAASQPWQAFVALGAWGIGPLVCLGVVLRLMVNSVSTLWKERLAHLRWHNPLPGSRANTLAHQDARIDTKSAPPVIAALLNDSMTPRERNSHWYTRIYRPIRDTPAISNTHRRYLLYREASTGAFILLVATTISDLLSRAVYGLPLMAFPAYLVSTAYVLLMIGAANQAGNRMVTGAIASHINMESSGGTQ